MKILSNLFLCALLLCALSACQKDVVQPITVQGKWEVTAASCQDGIQTIHENGSTRGGAFVFEGQSFSTEVEFKSDATFKGFGNYTKIFSTLENGTMKNYQFEANDFANEGEWGKNDVQLELIHNEVEKFEIIDLTSHKIILKFDLNETIENNNRTTQNVGTVYYNLRRK